MKRRRPNVTRFDAHCFTGASALLLLLSLCFGVLACAATPDKNLAEVDE